MSQNYVIRASTMSIQDKCNKTCGRCDSVKLVDVLTTLKNELSDQLEMAEKLKSPQLVKMINLSCRVLHFCHIKFWQMHQPQMQPPYEDLLAANLSLYWDLVLLQLRNLTGDEQGDYVKRLYTMTGCLLAHKPLYKLDVLLQQTQATELLHLQPVMKLCRCIIQSVTPVDHISYTKFILASKLFKHLDIIHQRAIDTSAPKHYLEWLRDQDAALLDNFPETPKFRGAKISRFLMEEADEDITEQLMDILTDGSFEESSENRVSSMDAEAVAAEAVEPLMLFHIDTIGSKPKTYLSDERIDKNEVEDDGILLESEGEEVEIIEIPDEVDQQDPLFDQVPIEIQEECHAMLMENEEDDEQDGKDSRQDEAEKLTEPMVIEADEEEEKESQDDEAEKLTEPIEIEADEQVEKESLEDESEKLTEVDGVVNLETSEQLSGKQKQQLRLLGKESLLPAGVDQLLSNGKSDVYEFASDSEFVPVKKRAISKRVAELKGNQDNGVPVKSKRRASMGVAKKEEMAESDEEERKIRRRSMPLHKAAITPESRTSKTRSSASLATSHEVSFTGIKTKSPAQSPEVTTMRKSSRQRSVPSRLVEDVPVDSMDHEKQTGPLTSVTPKQPIVESPKIKRRKSVRVVACESMLKDDSKQVSSDPVTAQDTNEGLSECQLESKQFELPMTPTRRSTRIQTNSEMSTASNEGNMTAMISLATGISRRKSMPLAAMMEEGTNEGLSESHLESNQFELPMTPTRRSTRIRTNSEMSTASNEGNITAMISLATGISRRKSMPMAAMMEEATSDPSGVKASPGRATRKRRSMAPSVN